MAWWIPVAMMAAGAAKGHLDQKAAKKKREAEAEIARWSPWTSMSAQRVDDGPGMLGGAIQGGLAGAQMYQAMGGGGSGGGGSGGGGSGGEMAAAPSSSAQGTPAPYTLYGSQGSPQMAQMDYSMYEQSPIMQYRPNTWTAMK